SARRGAEPEKVHLVRLAYPASLLVDLEPHAPFKEMQLVGSRAMQRIMAHAATAPHSAAPGSAPVLRGSYWGLAGTHWTRMYATRGRVRSRIVQIDSRWKKLISTRRIRKLYMQNDAPTPVRRRELEYLRSMEDEYGWWCWILLSRSVPRFTSTR